MRLAVCFFLLSITILAHAQMLSQSAQPLIFVDGIRAVFRGSAGTDLIMASELERARLDGTPNILDDMLKDLALAQEAKKYRLWPTPEEVEKQLRLVAQTNRRTPKELDELFITAGYTPQEGMNTFAQINAINSLVNFRITSNLFVSDELVTAYYNQHPEHDPASFHIQHTVIPFEADKESQEKQLQKIIDTGDPLHEIAWESSFWINQDELAEEKQFITQLKIGQISQPQETYTGFELFKLLNKKEARLKPLDERYSAIVNILRKPKYTELMDNFQQELMSNASIILFDAPNPVERTK